MENSLHHVDLNSSNLASMDYDDQTETLTITFHNGSVYTYDEVPETIAAGLASTDSPGTFFSANIKKQFRYHKQ